MQKKISRSHEILVALGTREYRPSSCAQDNFCCMPLRALRSIKFTKEPAKGNAAKRTVTGLFVPKTFRSQERIVHGELSFPRLFVPGTFVPCTFRSEELSFLRLFYKALAMNTDSYTNCQNLFRSITYRSSVYFQEINWISLRCVRVVFLLNKNAKWINVMMPVDKLTLIRPTSSVLCAVTHGTSKADRRAAKAGRPTYNVSWEVHNGVNIIRVKSQPNMQ